uniref:VWFA domain-containing protein n=1 Tax=Parastrongyloides trichosuri TaxID=131310 RepID=A0A0N5A2Z4_PARTI
MVCFVFLVDNSASMVARTWRGTTLLDEAKVWIDGFVRARLKDPVFSKVDKFLLYTSEEAVRHQKVILKDSGLLFFEQLRLIKPCGKANLFGALEQIFHYIHLNRKLNGCDRFGYGRSPQLLQDTVIIHLTDGLSQLRDEKLIIPQAQDSLQEFYDQPFRWDQKFFTLVLKISGNAPARKSSYQITNIECDPFYESFCQSAGGRSFIVTHVSMLNTITEHIFHRAGCVGTLVKFDLHGLSCGNENEKKNISKSLKTQPVLIREHRNPKFIGGWLIPENFWPADVREKFPTRTVNPTLIVKADSSFQFTDNYDFAFDKYELELCLLSTIMLKTVSENNKNNSGNYLPSNVCWPVFVENSGPKKGIGETFGFLKPNSTLTAIHLYLGPYNFLMLDCLIRDWKMKGCRIDNELNSRFENYLREIPMYYHNMIKKQTKQMKLTIRCLEEGNGLAITTSYPPRVVNILHKIKESGKKEMDEVNKSVTDSYQTCMMMSLGLIQIQSQQPISYPISYSRHSIIPSLLDEKNALVAPIGKLNDVVNIVKDLKKLRFDFSSNPSYSPFKSSHCYKNAYALRRSATEANNDSTLLNQTLKVMKNYDLISEEKNVNPFCGGVPGEKTNLCSIEEWQSQRIQGMGDYDSYSVKRIQLGQKILLRDPFEEINGKSDKLHQFGNPFKSDKKNVIDIDEVPEDKDEVENGNNGVNGNGKKFQRFDMTKKRKGPLDMDRVLSFYGKKNCGNLGLIRSDGYISEASTDISDTDTVYSVDSAFVSRSSSPDGSLTEKICEDFKKLAEKHGLDKDSEDNKSINNDVNNSVDSSLKTLNTNSVEDFKSLSLNDINCLKTPILLSNDLLTNELMKDNKYQNSKINTNNTVSENDATSSNHGSNAKNSSLNLLSAKIINPLKRTLIKGSFNPAAEAVEIKKKKPPSYLLSKAVTNNEEKSPQHLISINNTNRKRTHPDCDILELKRKVEESVREIEVDDDLYENIVTILKDTPSFSELEVLYRFCKRELTRFNKYSICSKLDENFDNIKQKKGKINGSLPE